MERKFTVEITESDLRIIDMALQEIPYRAAKPVITRLNESLAKAQTDANTQTLE